MATTRRRLKKPRSLFDTSTQPTMVIHVNIIVMNAWLTSFSFQVNRQSRPWDKAISDSDFETPRSRSWVWSKCKIKQWAQYPIPFHFTSIRPTIPKIQLFRNLTMKHPRSKSRVRSKVKATYYTQYPTNVLPYRPFHIKRTNHSWDLAKIVFDLETTHPKFLKKFC